MGYQHFDSEGWLTPVVNPHSYGLEGNQSAEGQAFILMLHAARRDYMEMGSARAVAAKHRILAVAGPVLGWLLM